MKVRGGKLKNQRRKKIKPEKIIIRNYEDEIPCQIKSFTELWNFVGKVLVVRGKNIAVLADKRLFWDQQT